MKAHDVVIAGLSIGFDSCHDLSQSYETIGGTTLHRMLNGAGVQQVHWRKIRTIISGSGRVPDGLAGVNFDSAIAIQCMAPLSLSAAGNVFTLPAARRTDWQPVGYALVSGQLVASPVVVVTNTATVQAVSGASGYQVLYWPILTCIAQPPSREFSGRGTVAHWSIEAEEA